LNPNGGRSTFINCGKGAFSVCVWGHEVYPHLGAWEGVGGDTERSFSAKSIKYRKMPRKKLIYREVKDICVRGGGAVVEVADEKGFCVLLHHALFCDQKRNVS
jgi:hypothetical protein